MDENGLKREIRKFARARRWEGDHSPKNLAMAVASEAGELLEVFQWLSEDESGKLSRRERSNAREELADVMIYALRLADVLKINMASAITDKLRKNAAKYPIGEFRGKRSRPRD